MPCSTSTMVCLRRVLHTALIVLLCALGASATTVVEPTTGITMAVADDGSYIIQTRMPAWTFAGALTTSAANIRANAGSDAIGEFREIEFEEVGASARRFSIRTWAGHNAVLFTQTLGAGRENPPAFPRFTSMPALPHRMSFAGKWFSAKFDLSGKEGPWVFFDDAGETAILSPAANFMVATMNVAANGDIESRIHPAIVNLPAGHSHATLLTFDRGINHALDTWGVMLTDLQGKRRPSNYADASLQYLGYWTDNGSAYYYNYDASKGGYEGTLLAIRDEYAKNGLPLGYLQLDSWWYPKGALAEWYPKPNQFDYGIATYTAASDVFPGGLASFRQRSGLPLVTHARWIDENSPYRSQYQISNNVATDPRYWNDIAAYLKASGVVTYEQDWLDSRATAAFTLEDQDAFLDNMASALAANGITMQYCMGMPRDVMQGSKYSNLTTIRVSEDHFARDRWPLAVYSSRFASSVGIWPWVDVFSSNSNANMLFATLTAGVVGTSDAIGAVDRVNVRRAARIDGVLVKPDTALIPTQSTIIADAQGVAGPMVAFATSDNDGSRASYVLAFQRNGATHGAFNAAETGVTGTVFVYDTRTHAGFVTEATSSIPVDITDDWAHFVIVPVSASGVAIVGDEAKYATRGRMRIAAVRNVGSDVEADVVFAPTEAAVTLRGYASHAPEFAPVSGSVKSASWNATTHLFDVTVAPDASGNARLLVKNGVRRRTVARDNTKPPPAATRSGARDL